MENKTYYAVIKERLKGIVKDYMYSSDVVEIKSDRDESELRRNRDILELKLYEDKEEAKKISKEINEEYIRQHIDGFIDKNCVYEDINDDIKVVGIYKYNNITVMYKDDIVFDTYGGRVTKYEKDLMTGDDIKETMETIKKKYFKI